mgnify:CR=1 FL=1
MSNMTTMWCESVRRENCDEHFTYRITNSNCHLWTNAELANCCFPPDIVFKIICTHHEHDENEAHINVGNLNLCASNRTSECFTRMQDTSGFEKVACVPYEQKSSIAAKSEVVVVFLCISIVLLVSLLLYIVFKSWCIFQQDRRKEEIVLGIEVLPTAHPISPENVPREASTPAVVDIEEVVMSPDDVVGVEVHGPP